LQPKPYSAVRDDLGPAENVVPLRNPDMDVLAAGRRAPPAMPSEMFGGVWSLILDLAEGAGAPADYVALSFLGAAASLIGGKRKVRPFKTAAWAEPCILWAALVGDPSSNKSPALSVSTDALREMEQDHADAHESALLNWQAHMERAKCESAAWADLVKQATKDGLSTPAKPQDAVDPEVPVRRRLLTIDCTPESLAAILAGNPAGTLHLRDELAGWLLSFDRYSQGGREFWLEAFGGRAYTVDRKGAQKPLTIRFNGVSLIGGIQPDKLADCLLNSADDGLVPRFLWAWPDAIPFRRPRQIADIGQLQTIYRRLDSLDWGMTPDGRESAVTLTLDDAAADLFERWAQENDLGLQDAGALYKGFCGKLKGTVLRLALIATYVDWAQSSGDLATQPKSVSARTIGAAIEFVESYAKPAAKRVFGDAALPKAERDAAILARYILRKKLRRINARDLKRSPHKVELPTMREAHALNDALALLCDADWLEEVGSRQGDSPGRKSADYLVNPKLLEAANG
jgi:putative DNA primase/helicase